MRCCDEKQASPLDLPAGLTSLPRQLRGFPEVRRDLLRALGGPGPLVEWEPSGDDFGLMWLEMWAYVSDVLGFYDERVANETYLRTATRRPSLRRIVALLGHTPRSGIAASASLAALADGVVAVTLPPGTGFRSGAFGDEPPQVFETTTPSMIHPLKNQWTITSIKRRPRIDAVPDVTDAAAPANQKKAGPSQSAPNVHRLLFEPEGFGLSAAELVLFDSRQAGATGPVDPAVTLVGATEPIEGRDSQTYIQVSLEPAVRIHPETDLSQVRARRPTQTATPTNNKPVVEDGGKTTHLPVENLAAGTRVYLDLPPNTFRRSTPVIVARNLAGAGAAYELRTIGSVRSAAVTITSIPRQTVPIPQPENAPPLQVEIPSPSVAATELMLEPALPASFASNPDQLTILYGFVDGGQPTNVGRSEIGMEDLFDSEGVPLDGLPQPPPEAVESAEATGLAAATNIAGVLEQEFLIVDAARRGARVDGRITFTSAGSARFEALVPEQLPDGLLRLPLTIYGNIVETTRGESVAGEVLGNGNARVPNQQFKLRKKPLTYVALASSTGTSTSTLQIRVDGVLWRETRTFFGCGPQDTVYTVHHDDAQNTLVTFGDGVRGARLPSGVKNVVANYRVGAGAAAPPAGAVTQLAGSVKGLRGVRSPIAAGPGKDPDDPDELRTNAPRSALLFGRAVSAADVEALAREQPGVVQARAEWLWIDAQMQAGVEVHYIGDADPATIIEALRAQADPTVPIEVLQATAIRASVSIGVEVGDRYSKEAVAGAVEAHLTAPGTGVLSLERARVGGTFWPSVLYEAILQVDGAIAVAGISFSTDDGPAISSAGGTCIETGMYLDFSAPDSVSVTGLDPLGSVAHTHHGGAQA